MPTHTNQVGSGPWIPDYDGALQPTHFGTNMQIGYIPLSLGDWRLIGSNDIPIIAVASGNGGNLASDTAPKLIRVNAATDKKLTINWAATSVIEITADFQYPPDLDYTKPITFNMRAKMGGATDIPVVAVGWFTGVGDTNAGGNTAAVTGTTEATYSKAIAANHVGGYPLSTSVTLTPAAHGTDTLVVLGTWITYSRMA